MHILLDTHLPLTVYGVEQLHYMSIKSRAWITCSTFAESYPLISSDKLWNINGKKFILWTNIDQFILACASPYGYIWKNNVKTWYKNIYLCFIFHVLGSFSFPLTIIYCPYHFINIPFDGKWRVKGLPCRALSHDWDICGP